MKRSLLSIAALSTALLGAAIVPACGAAGDEAIEEESGEEAYTTEGTCDGLPKLKNLKTPPGVCVGVVATGFTFARGIAELENGDLVVAEMGGWAKDRGGVWLLRRKEDKTYAKTKLNTLIDKPSGVAVGPDGLPYIGTPDAIYRFDPYSATLKADPTKKLPKTGSLMGADVWKQPRITLVVKNLPGDLKPNGESGARHPLKKFVFDPKNPWTMLVNVGSASDTCEQKAGARPPTDYPMPCAEAEGQNARGTIRKYVLDGPDHTATSFSVLARGLRNSMAIAVHPQSGAIIQGENSRDAINKLDASLTDQEGDLPHEELNVIEAGGHYGWPYCFDNGTPNPEYRGRVNCTNYKNPALLLPGHVSPLGMAYYTGSMFPEAYKNNLLVTYHGYREYGHRLVLVPVDSRGVPGAGEPLDIIRGWEKSADGRDPQGAPVDVLVAKDGSIYVTEDKNGTVLRVVFDPRGGNGAPMRPLPPQRPVVSADERARCDALRARSDAFSRVQRDVIDTSCVGCHGAGPGYAGGLALLKCDAVGNAKRLTERRGNREPYVTAGNVNSELVLRLKGQGYPQMPAGGVSPEHLSEVEQWIREGARVPQ
ncbi:MAG: PQQ-dependent sugar dehydrogenase [Deltaproteobacteria bacterium]|nr:PQQ-dependent sugar dehydrogenase [Deltaproteobacteria bacterium]